MKQILNLLSNKKIRLSIIIVLVLIFIIIMVAAIAKSRAQNQTTEVEEPQIIEITDELKDKMPNYLKYLSSGSYCEINATISFTDDCLYRQSTTTVDNLSTTYRLVSLVNAIGSLKSNNMMVGTITIENVIFTNPSYVELSEVEKAYQEIYGSNSTFDPSLVNSVNTYSIKYDDSRKKFFYNNETKVKYAQTYITSYESNETSVSVHLRVGYITYENYKYHLFKTKDATNEITSLTTREYKENDIITESNYTELSEYIVTFVKDENSNNLVFNNIKSSV